MEKQVFIRLLRNDPTFGIADCGHLGTPDLICSRCTTCFICGKSRGDIELGSNFTNRGNNGQKFWYHKCCIRNLGCTRISVEVILASGGYLMRLTCSKSYDQCHKCNKMIFDPSKDGYFVELRYSSNGEDVWFHHDCAPERKCVSCRWSYQSGVKSVVLGDFMYHDSLSCQPPPCMLCEQKIDGIPKSIPLKGYDRYNLVHAERLDKAVCSRCEHRGHYLYLDPAENEVKPSDFISDPEGISMMEKHEFSLKSLVHPNLDCLKDICPLCEEGIADFPWILANDNKFHSKCVAELNCYVCITSIGHKIISGDSRGFRHSDCDPTLCGGCGEIIGKKNMRTLYGIIYHLYCGPSCIACGGRNDGLYQITECGNYLHSDCDSLRCFVCLTYLGRNQDCTQMLIHAQKVHKQCRFECPKCCVEYPNIKTIRADDHVQVKNLPFVPSQVKANLRALWRVARLHRVPKDVIRLLLLIGVNRYTNPNLNGPDIMPSIPFRRNFDLRMICTPRRCQEDKCDCCEGKIAWSKKDDTRCHPNRCKLITDAYTKIITKVFKQEERFFGL